LIQIQLQYTDWTGVRVIRQDGILCAAFAKTSFQSDGVNVFLCVGLKRNSVEVVIIDQQLALFPARPSSVCSRNGKCGVI
jgi:hypothetical protein